MKEAGAWRPIAEAMPEEFDSVWGWVKSRRQNDYGREVFVHGAKWCVAGGDDLPRWETVVAWQPLPTPPQQGAGT